MASVQALTPAERQRFVELLAVLALDAALRPGDDGRIVLSNRRTVEPWLAQREAIVR